MHTKIHRIALLTMSLAALMASGCSNESDQTLLQQEGTGTASLALSIPEGLVVAQVTAVITFPDGTSQTHTLDVTQQGTTATLMFRLPVNDGYTIDLDAETSGGDICAGVPSVFDIHADAVTDVVIELVCPGAARANGGTASVTGVFSVADGSTTCASDFEKIVVFPAKITDPRVPVKVQPFLRRDAGAAGDVAITASAGSIAGEGEDWTFECGTAQGPVTLEVSTGGASPCVETLVFECPAPPTPPGPERYEQNFEGGYDGTFGVKGFNVDDSSPFGNGSSAHTVPNAPDGFAELTTACAGASHRRISFEYGSVYNVGDLLFYVDAALSRSLNYSHTRLVKVTLDVPEGVHSYLWKVASGREYWIDNIVCDDGR